ncbi:MAG TPA: hypothetical protein VN813_03475 [Luteibacter sp.]|nr:hypothetical protein [Luteibacter sp.]
MTDNTPLSFDELNRRIEAMPDFENARSRAPKRAKVLLKVAVASGLLAVLMYKMPLPGLMQLVIESILLAVEIGAFIAHLWFSRSIKSTFAPIRDHAHQLDHDILFHEGLVAWLASQPAEVLRKHADFSRFRRERMDQKLPLLIGGFQLLGILPLGIAAYLQVREIVAGRHIGWLEVVAGLTLAMLYAAAWTSALTKTRLDAMDMFLQDAVSRQANLATGESPSLVECRGETVPAAV